MRLIIWVSVLLLVAPASVCGEGSTRYLPNDGGGQIRVIQRVCTDDNLYVHHDGTFEGGVAWEMSGVVPPYDGAFGEAYDLGPGGVECVSLWLTQDGWNMGQSSDVYVWEGGVASAPGNVLAVATGVVFEDIPIFPDGGRYDVEIPAAAAGAFTVGSWGNWPDAGQGYFWLVDQDGPEGYPWTHVAEGTGFPQGWQDPEPIWGVPIHSMGIGVHFTGGGSPAVPTTWGSVKSLFATAR